MEIRTDLFLDDLFKKELENLISKVFSDLTLNQKMSIMNLLMTVGVCDGEQGNPDKELRYLNTYVDILDVRSDRSMAYLKLEGHQKMINDLKLLSESQKKFLVVAAFEMIICDGRPNETELTATGKIFEQIGIDKNKFVATIEETQALHKHFNK